MRRYLNTLLALTLVLAAFATTFSQPGAPTTTADAAERHTADRLELSSVSGSQDMRFTLYDGVSAEEIASGEMTYDAARSMQIFSVRDQSGQLVEITQENPDPQHLRITIASRSVKSDFNFDVAQLNSLYNELVEHQDVKSLDAGQMQTFKQVGLLRRATLTAIGTDLHERLVRALSEQKSESMESESLAAALGARNRVAAGLAGRPPTCASMAVFSYQGCIRNGHSVAECVIYAMQEFWDCVTWTPEQY